MTERELHDLERSVRGSILYALKGAINEDEPDQAFLWANVYGAITFDDSRDAVVTEPAA